MTSSTNKEYSVNWKNHMSYVRKAFNHLLTSSELTDVTLCCEGRKIGAHKMLLSACSKYFRDTFKEVPCKHPVIVLYGVEFSVLTDILHFIYNGEVSVDTSKLDSFLKIAQLLQISGLTGVASEKVTPDENTSEARETEETYQSIPSLTADETRRKRTKPNEVNASVPDKIQKTENDAVFISDVKCEPSELINFEDPLEDPLLQGEQNDSKDHLGNVTDTNATTEDFKLEASIEVEEENTSKRFGEEIYTEKKLIPFNTIKSRSSIWTAFRKFCQQRKYTWNENTSTEEVSKILADYALNMRRIDGSDYKANVVKTIWNTTARMLQDMFYDQYNIKFDPFRDVEFRKARDARDIKRQQLKSIADKSRINTVYLNAIEWKKLFCQWDENTPSGLQKKFFHMAWYLLGWKIYQASSCLIHFFVEELDFTGTFTGRIEYNPTLGNTTEASCSHTTEKKWLVANKFDPDICPVRLLRKLLNKRNTNTQIKTNRLFLTPNPSWNKTDRNPWYKDAPVGKNQMAAWIKEVNERIGFDLRRVKLTESPHVNIVISSN